MKLNQKIKLAVMLGLTLALSACVSMGPYHTVDAKHKQKNEIFMQDNGFTLKDGTYSVFSANFTEKYAKGKTKTFNPKTDIAFVEFGKNGTLEDPGQLAQAITEAKKATGMVIIYVHGWNNNAKSAEESGDVRDLAVMMHEIEEAYDGGGTQFRGKKHAAIYIGWRGKTMRDPVSHLFTIWDRRRAARNIGNSPEFQNSIAQIVGGVRNNNPKAKVFVVGHSLGAALVEKGATRMVSDGFGEKNLLPDMFFTLNSAEVGRTFLVNRVIPRGRQFDSLSTYNRMTTVKDSGMTVVKDSDYREMLQGKRMMKPHIINVQGDGDSLVRIGIPVSSLFAYGFTHRSIGFARGLQSHRFDNPRDQYGVQNEKTKPWSKPEMTEVMKEGYRTAALMPQNSGEYAPKVLKGVNNRLGPVINVKVSEHVVGGHNDVYNYDLLLAASSLYRYSYPGNEDQYPVILGKVLEKLKSAAKRRVSTKEYEFVLYMRFNNTPRKLKVMLTELEKIPHRGSAWEKRYAEALYAALIYLHPESSLNEKRTYYGWNESRKKNHQYMFNWGLWNVDEDGKSVGKALDPWKGNKETMKKLMQSKFHQEALGSLKGHKDYESFLNHISTF